MLRLAILCGLTLWTGSLQAEQARLRALILSTNPPTAAFLKTILEQSGRFKVSINEALSGITAETLAPFDVVILKDHTVPLQPVLDRYIKSGKGLFVFGSGAGQTKEFFEVSFVDRQHPIGIGMPERFTATEVMPRNVRVPAGIKILAATDDSQGSRQPVIWTIAPAGEGRTVFSTLGSDLAAMYGDGFASTFIRGAEWAATGKVTLPAQVDLFRPPANPIRVLVVTGGHTYPTSFYSLFEGRDDMVWDHATASIETAFKSDLRKKYDVLVLYDWYRDEPSGVLRENLVNFLESGKGVVILHHGISDFNYWPWWQEKVQGAKYFFKPEGDRPASSYKHDQDLFLVPVAPHPITKGIGPFRLIDETYHGMWYSPEITVLLKMTSPLKDTPVAWIGPYEKSRVVYMLPGHDEKSHYHPVFRELVHRAILWTGRRLD